MIRCLGRGTRLVWLRAAFLSSHRSLSKYDTFLRLSMALKMMCVEVHAVKRVVYCVMWSDCYVRLRCRLQELGRALQSILSLC
jgi:hypothetical protein